MTFRSWKILLIVLFVFCQLLYGQASIAGDYLESAHGSLESGVRRVSVANEGFARGNCTHCHGLHTDVQGVFPFSLYGQSFDTSKRTAPYAESANFCFSCHSQHASVQKVLNNDYSQTSGCSTLPGPLDILGAFNQNSSHNLYDIWNFMSEDTQDFKWFGVSSNPCSACHNSHNARSRKNKASDIVYSSISRPIDSLNLWTVNMGTVYELQYEPPFCSTLSNRESAGSYTAEEGRANTIDYVSFCIDCHNKDNTIYSTVLERNLIKFDWSVTGDIHGEKSTEGNLAVKPPYQPNGKQNYVLSCLDCHEPHGSENVTLLRRRVNGGDLLGSIMTPMPLAPGTGENNTNIELGFLCVRCHQQDIGTGESSLNPPAWENVHHDMSDSPYDKMMCSSCHPPAADETSEAQEPIACDKCHFHGSSDIWLQSGSTGKDTF